MPLLKTVCHWWDDEEDFDDEGVLGYLGVSRLKQKEIREQFCSDEDRAVSKCIELVLHQGSVSWRKIINSLDNAEETEVADGIRKFAEPLAGEVRHSAIQQVVPCNCLGMLNC